MTIQFCWTILLWFRSVALFVSNENKFEYLNSHGYSGHTYYVSCFTFMRWFMRRKSRFHACAMQVGMTSAKPKPIVLYNSLEWKCKSSVEVCFVHPSTSNIDLLSLHHPLFSTHSLGRWMGIIPCRWRVCRIYGHLLGQGKEIYAKSNCSQET